MRVTEAEYQAMVAKNGTVAQGIERGTSKATVAGSSPAGPTKNKFGAVKTEYEGIVFDSRHEADCWIGLRLREQHGTLTGLRRQVPFAIVIDGLHVCDYVADFVWMEGAARVVADAKGYKNPVYRLKRKLMQAVNQIEIREL